MENAISLSLELYNIYSLISTETMKKWFTPEINLSGGKREWNSLWAVVWKETRCRPRVFGCMAYAHVPDSERRKLDKKSRKMRFVGYSLTSKRYLLFDETNQKMYIWRDVEFNENDFG